MEYAKYAFSMKLEDDAKETPPEEIKRQQDQIRERMGKLFFADTPEEMPTIHVENMPDHKTNQFYKYILSETRKFVRQGSREKTALSIKTMH